MKKILTKRQGNDGEYVAAYKAGSVLMMISVSTLVIVLIRGIFLSFILLKILSILILIPVIFLFVFAIFRCKIAFWEAEYQEFPPEYPFFTALPAGFEAKYKLLCFSAGHFVAVQPTNEGFSVIQPFWSGKSSSMFLLRSLSRNNQYYFFKIAAEVSTTWTRTLLNGKDCLSAFSTQLGSTELKFEIQKLRIADLDQFCNDTNLSDCIINDAKTILNNTDYLPLSDSWRTTLNEYIRQRLQDHVLERLGVEYDNALRQLSSQFHVQIGNTVQSLNAAIVKLASEVEKHTTTVCNSIFSEFLKEFHANSDEYLQFGVYEFKLSKSSMQINSTFTEYLMKLQNKVQGFLAQGNLPIQNLAQILQEFVGIEPTLFAFLQPVINSMMNPIQQQAANLFDLDRLLYGLQVDEGQRKMLINSGIAERAFVECNQDFAETRDRLNAFLQHTNGSGSDGMYHEINMGEYTAWQQKSFPPFEKKEQ